MASAQGGGATTTPSIVVEQVSHAVAVLQEILQREQVVVVDGQAAGLQVFDLGQPVLL